MRGLIYGAAMAIAMPNAALADCVFNAKTSTSYTVIDSKTIVLQGGASGPIMIKLYCCVYPSSRLMVLKDSFCSYEDAVLYIDGKPVAVIDVKRLN